MFGKKEDNGSGILSGASWRKRLMPTAVNVTSNQPAKDSHDSTSTASDDKITKTSPQSSEYLPSFHSERSLLLVSHSNWSSFCSAYESRTYADKSRHQ